MKRIPRRPKEHVRDHEPPAAVSEDLSTIRIGSLVRVEVFDYVGKVVNVDRQGLVKIDPEGGGPTHGWFDPVNVVVISQPPTSSGQTRTNPARGVDMKEIMCQVDALALRAIRDHLLEDMSVKSNGGLRRAFIHIDRLVEDAEDSLQAASESEIE